MTETNASVSGFAIDPLDVLFFRDGRPFETGSQASSGLPMPQTLTGALRTWLLQDARCDFDRFSASLRKGASFAEAAAEQGSHVQRVASASFRGPWLARDGEPLVPVPASLRRFDGTNDLLRLDPLQDDLPGWTCSDANLRPLWCRSPRHAKRIDGFLCMDGLARFLKGKTPEAEQVLKAEELFGYDRRIGIGIEEASTTAGEGLIYTVSLLALKLGVTLYAEIEGPQASLTACRRQQLSHLAAKESERLFALLPRSHGHPARLRRAGTAGAFLC